MRNGPVKEASLRAEIDDQQLSRLLRFDQRLARTRIPNHPAVQRRNSAIGDVWGPRGHRSDFPIADRCCLGYLDDLISFGASSRFLKSAGLGGARGDRDKQGPDRSSRSGAVAACDRRRGRKWIQLGPFEENLLGSGGGVSQAQAEQPSVD